MLKRREESNRLRAGIGVLALVLLLSLGFAASGAFAGTPPKQGSPTTGAPPNSGGAAGSAAQQGHLKGGMLPRSSGPSDAKRFPPNRAVKPLVPNAPVNFILDDGTAEDSVSFNNGVTETAAIWLNRFTPVTGSYPVTLTNISIYWPNQTAGNIVGLPVKLLVYNDADGNNDPTNATLISTIDATINVTNTFQNYPVNVTVAGPGDLYIGFEDFYAEPNGYSPIFFPAAIDETPPSQVRSWVAGMGDGSVPNRTNLGANDTVGIIDSFGLPGNWLIRASGSDGQLVTATPTSTATATSTPPSCGPGSNYLVSATSGATIVPGTTDTGNHADDGTTAILLPFTYNLYGVPFTAANVDSNGTLQLGSNTSVFTNACLPSANGQTYTIYGHWDDLYTVDTAGGQGIFTSISGTAPNRIFNIEWRAQFCCSSGAPVVNFEIRLYEGLDKFDIIYGSVQNLGSSATVGVQRLSGAGAQFTQYECNTGGLTSGLKLTFEEIPCGANTFTPTGTATSTPTPVCTPSWTQQAPYPIPILDQAVVAHSGKLYSFAGVSTSIIANAYSYDPGTNAWTAIAAYPVAREWPSAVSNGALIYILNGADTSGLSTGTLYSYDPGTNTYTSLAPDTTLTWNQAAVYLGGKIYRIGGSTASGVYTNSVDAYDIASNTWSAVAPYPVAGGIGFAMAVARSGFIYVAGGTNALGESLKAYRYDPGSNTWDDAAVTDLPATRWGAANDMYNGEWLVAGGYSGNIINSDVQAYNFTTNTWNPKDPMLNGGRARMQGATLPANPYFYSVGGRDPVIGGFTGTTDNQRYFPAPCGITFTPTVTRTATNTATATGTPTATPPSCGPGSNYLASTSTGATIDPGTTDSGNHCDDCTTTITLPFSYNLYGVPYTSVNAGSNGSAQFAGGTYCCGYGSPCVPNTSFTTPSILPYNADLNTTAALSGCTAFGSGCGVFTSVSGTAPNRVFNIEWRAVYFSDNTKTANFELRLYEGQDKFDVVFGTNTNTTFANTAGVQLSAGTFTQTLCGTGNPPASGTVVTYLELGCGSLTPTPTNTPTITNTPTRTFTVTVTNTPSCTPESYNIATATATIDPGVTDIGNHSDDVTTLFNLPFNYSLYGTSYTQARASSNGVLEFGATSSTSFSNVCLPTATLPTTILPYWDDLRTDGTTGEGIFTSTVGSAPNRIFNIEWRACIRLSAAVCTAIDTNFEVRLYEGQQKFDVVYGPSVQSGSGATSGVEKDTLIFTQYSCNTATLTNGLAVTYTYTTGTCATPTPTSTFTATLTPTVTLTPSPTPSCGPGADYVITQATAVAINPGVTLIAAAQCDDCVSAIAIPFPVSLYGTSFTSVNASSNGNLQFSSSSTSLSNVCLPTGTGSLVNAILPHWDDLDMRTTIGAPFTPGIYTDLQGTAPNRIFVVEYRACLYNGGACGAGTANFEVIFHEGTDQFDFVYGTVSGNGVGATIGVQQGSGPRNTQFSCNTASLSTGLKLTFQSPPCATGIITGHLTWQTVPQPNARNVQTATLTLCNAGVPASFVANIDASGFFTVTSNLPNGNYNWWIKGERHLANAGTLTIAGGVSAPEMGTMRGGDAIHIGTSDNLVDSADFNNLRAFFGIPSPPDLRSDFDFTGLVDSADFNILRANFGIPGAPHNCP